jgi:hypothetical protein
VPLPPPGCPDGRTRCGEDCVDLQTHKNNCGACGTQCKGKRVCVAGACVGVGLGDDD